MGAGRGIDSTSFSSRKTQFSAFLTGQPVRSLSGAFHESKENICSDFKASAVGRDVSVAQ